MGVIEQAVRAINQFDRLTHEDFERIVSKFDLDPASEELISALLDEGWVHILQCGVPLLDGPWEYIRDGESHA